MNSQMECTQNLRGAAYKLEQRQLKPSYLLELLLKNKLVDFQRLSVKVKEASKNLMFAPHLAA